MLRYFSFIVLFILSSIGYSQLPDGFYLEEIDSDIESPMGMVFAGSEDTYIFNKDGQVFIRNQDVISSTPVIDLSEEVGSWHDHGLLSVALHPDFSINGFIYLYYVVDRHHLLHHGTPGYDTDSTESFNATIARLTRLTIDTQDYSQLIPGSRKVLIGDSLHNGIPIMAKSHAGGSLMFGADKTLMLTTGDGTWNAYNGEGPLPASNYDDQALEDGLIRPDENIGTWRAQYINSLNGKLLRIDPLTGEGIASNPFYEESNPSSARSRIWALGLRNPFRAVINPLNGSTDPNAGNPGSVYIGDVGFYSWEELNVSNGPGMNFGWPLYEGMEPFYLFDQMVTSNPDEPNPLANTGDCPPYFSFHDLIQQPRESHNELFLNPCDQLLPIADSVMKFVHSRPTLTWVNQITSPPENITLLPGFNSEGEHAGIPAEDSGLEIEEFDGSASLGGAFYIGGSYPEEYFGKYFHTDFKGWIKVFSTNDADEMESVEHFTTMYGVAHVAYNPYDESIYFTTVFPGTIYKLVYGGNRAPQIELETTTPYGSSPLMVDFDASETLDPEADLMEFEWDFGDGNVLQGPDIISHVFTSPSADPVSYTVTLTVTDSTGNSSAKSLLVSLNNTPPQIEITSIDVDQEYNGFIGEIIELQANVSDLETENDQLEYRWEMLLHHNNHYHLEEAFFADTAQSHVEGIGCNTVETYYYRVTLEVTDPYGLSSYDERYLYPKCDTSVVIIPTLEQYLVYPNPSDGDFVVRGPMTEGDQLLVEVFNSMGQRVYSEDRWVDEFGRIGVSIPRDKTGQYILRLSSNSKTEIVHLHLSSW